MAVLIHDTLAQFEPLLTEAIPPKDKLARARETVLAEDAEGTALNKALRDSPAFHVMGAARVDGFSAGDNQQGWGLFNPRRRMELSVWEYAQYAQHGYPALITQHVAPLLAQVAPGRDVHIYPVPCDVANRAFMIDGYGASVFGFEGNLLVRVLPSAGNMRRLLPLLAYGLVGAVRPRPRTLADWLARVGLGVALAATVAPDDTAPWQIPVRAADDWPATLQWVAEQYGLSRYDDMTVNIYGQESIVGNPRLPVAAALDADDLDYSVAVIRDAFDVSDPAQLAAYLYGDAIVAPHGHPGVGLSQYAGLAVAYHLVQSRLQQADLATLIAASTDAIVA